MMHRIPSLHLHHAHALDARMGANVDEKKMLMVTVVSRVLRLSGVTTGGGHWG